MIVELGNGVVLDLTIDVTNEWNNGFITKVTLKNLSEVPLESWSLNLDLPPSVLVQNSQLMNESQNGEVASFAPDAAWLSEISPGETGSFTFRSSKSSTTDVTDILPLDFVVAGTSYPLEEPTENGSVSSDLIVKSTWGNGAWLQVVITNNGPDAISNWELPIDLPEGLTFASSGSVRVLEAADGTTQLVPTQAFLNTIPAGDSIAFGFNVSGNPALVSDIMLGELGGLAPPIAVNDTGLDYEFDAATGVLTLDIADILANDRAADGGPVSMIGAFTVAGGGNARVEGDVVRYQVQPTESGRIVIGYEVADNEDLRTTAQVFVDLPTAPLLTVGDITVDESAGTATFAVTLTGALALLDTVEVDYTTRERSALAGVDFVGKTGSLTFDDETRTQLVTVDLLDNTIEELTETFDLVLSNARGARIDGPAGVATIVDDATDTGPIGDTTPGLDIETSIVGEFVVGHTLGLTITNNSGATLTGNPIVTVGVQDGMKLVTQTGNYSQLSGSNVTQDGQASIVASHDDRYFTLAINPSTAGGLNPDLADGTWDDGDTANIELFLNGSHFFAPLEERIQVSPELMAEQPERDFVPLDLTFKGFNTSFLNRSNVTQADIDASFAEQQALGANSIAIVTTHFMDDKNATTVKATDFTMTDAALVNAIRTAKDDGLDVLLKPHIDLESGEFRGRLLSTAGPAKVDEFFGRQDDGTYAAGSYGELITRYAGIAQAEEVEVMLIGTELVDLAKNRANLPHWEQLIEDVNEIYDGELSYATIVGEELFVRFWDDLDYISLDIYPPLTDAAAPSVGELIDGWTELPTTERGLEAYFNLPITDLIAGMSEQYDKKVLITETGFRSVDGAAARPFDFDLEGYADLQEQQDAYESFFAAAMNDMGGYLDGVFLWQYLSEPSAGDGTIVQPAGYTPQNKPVIDLVGDFFDFA